MNVGHNLRSSFLSKSSKTEAKRGSNIRPDCDYKNGKQHHYFLLQVCITPTHLYTTPLLSPEYTVHYFLSFQPHVQTSTNLL